MYKSFELRNFQGFGQTRVDHLARINLIAGENNIGKTSLLEGLFIHCGAYNPDLLRAVKGLRGIRTFRLKFSKGAETPWDSFFHEFQVDRNIELIAEDERNKCRRLRIRLITDPEEIEERVGKQVISKGTDKIRKRAGDQAISEGGDGASAQSQTVQPNHLIAFEGDEDGRRYSYNMVVDQDGIHPLFTPPGISAILLGARYMSEREDASRFGVLQERKEESIVVNSLKVIEPRLENLITIAIGEEVSINGDIGLSRRLPLTLMGGGIARLGSIVLAIGNCPKGVLLLDEVENGLYHSSLPKVWEVIRDAALNFDVQVFATTHSLECISAAYETFKDEDNIFRLHRLERIKGEIRAVTYDPESLKAALESGFEVR